MFNKTAFKGIFMPDWLLNMTLNWLWKEGVYPNTEKKSSGISQCLKQILVRR